jgi:hypothetical protein
MLGVSDFGVPIGVVAERFHVPVPAPNAVVKFVLAVGDRAWGGDVHQGGASGYARHG